MQKKPMKRPVKKLSRWLLASVTLLVIVIGAFGSLYPELYYVGFIVPVAMLAGVFGSFKGGRYVCGNICPRGSFYDTYFRPFAGSKKIPSFFWSKWFRWSALVLLMSFMTFRLSQNISDMQYVGSVFWFMCFFTTLIGVVLGFFFRSRTWCSFCPVGTLSSAIGGYKNRFKVESSCKSCKLCESHCPMGLSIAEHKGGTIPHNDCLKCNACAKACPVKAISWEREKSA